MPPLELEWVEFTDFSPGIHNNTRFAGGVNVNAMNPCMAQETDTYRCRALVTGGLGPLPRRKKSFGLTNPPTGAASYRVAGFNVLGQIIAENIFTTDHDNRAEIHAIVTWYSGGANRLRWFRERIYDTTPSTETLVAKNHTTALDALTQYAPIMKTRMWPNDTIQPGRPVMVALARGGAALDDPGEASARLYRVHPDPHDPLTNNTVVLGSEAEDYDFAITHQGRVVIAKYILYNRGVNTRLTTNANFLWTPVNTNTVTMDPPAVFAVELDQFVSDMGSMTANELLVILALGGGYIVTGDLDDPTVISLPNIAGPDGNNWVKGCNTAIGYVYSAGYAGLYVWNGGDDATPISEQLEGSSFDSNDGQGVQGTCDRWMDMVLAPRNWIYDANQKSWWRIDDPSEVLIRNWATSKYRGQTYGAEIEFSSSDPNCFHMYEYDDPATSYTWKSHPIWISRDRRMNVREIVCAVSGNGTITFTVTNELGESQSIPISFNHTQIRNYREAIGIGGQNFTLRIQSQGATVESVVQPAPLMHRCYVGYQPTTYLGPT